MWRCHFLLWTVAAVTASSEEPLYRKTGDKAVFTPDSVVNPINSITWKHELDIAMEWYGGETFSYRHFKDRGTLNISTGVLTITGLTRDDSGNYTAEINNNKVTSKTKLLVISPVSKPTLSVWCEPEMTYCVFTCNGSTTGAEPVTYRWKSGDMTWPSTKEYKITKEEKEPWFSCVFENPVSFKSSEKVPNPFINGDQSRTRIGLIAAIGVNLLCCSVLCILFCRKEKPVDGTAQEMSGMLDPTSVVISTISEVHETPTQYLETAVSPDTSNETERPASLLGVQETSTQDTTSTVPPETSNETERSATSPEVPETSTQDLEPAVRSQQ